ncbi:MAG: hypothetical protein SGI73_06865 [Chloroflexota bacterium]|nr:hypothetical protein [Chloroflexota bacterium]
MTTVVLGVSILIMTIACNLASVGSQRESAVSETPTDSLQSLETTLPTFEAIEPLTLPTALPLLGGSAPNIILTPMMPFVGTPATDGSQRCDVYSTYSGGNPANTLSMRSTPSGGAEQIVRLPNASQVFRIPNSQEIDAEGYHWLNIIYVDARQNRYEGWTARDSYQLGGVRDPSVATLRPTGQQTAC